MCGGKHGNGGPALEEGRPDLFMLGSNLDAGYADQLQATAWHALCAQGVLGSQHYVESCAYKLNTNQLTRDSARWGGLMSVRGPRHQAGQASL